MKNIILNKNSILCFIIISFMIITFPWVYYWEKIIFFSINIILTNYFIRRFGLHSSEKSILRIVNVICGIFVLFSLLPDLFEKTLDRKIIGGVPYCIVERTYFYEESEVFLVKYPTLYIEEIVAREFYSEGAPGNLKILVSDGKPSLSSGF